MECANRRSCSRSNGPGEVISCDFGVGVAIGYATCGQIGFDGRYEYTAIGTVVNLAARLCGEAGGGEVLVSQRVIDQLGSAVIATPVGDIALKGMGSPVPTFRVERFAP